MTDLVSSYEEIEAFREKQRALTAEAQERYFRVFFGTPTEGDQAFVRRDLETFCGARTRQYVPGARFEEVTERTGMLRVWQRINAFCDPRPADALTERGQDEQRNDGKLPGPTAGGGVTERTDD